MKTRKIVSKYLRYLGVFIVLGLVGNNTLFAGSTPFENRALDIKCRNVIERQGYCYTKDKVSGELYLGEFDSKSKRYRLVRADNSVDSTLLYDDYGMPLLGSEQANCSEQEELYEHSSMENIYVGTKGIEDRDLMTEAEKQIPEYKRIGVFTANFGSVKGTATVIGKNCDKILVSAHLERSDKNISKKYNNFRFYPNPQNLGNKIPAKKIMSGWSDESRHGLRKYDYAIFQLERSPFSYKECEDLGKVHVKKWDSNNPERSSCLTHMSKVALNTEDMRNKRIHRSFYGQEPRDSGREIETYQSDSDATHATSGAPDWCHEDGTLKLSGITYGGKGDNPKGYQIEFGKKLSMNTDGNGENDYDYNRNSRYSASTSIWSGFEKDLIDYVGKESFVFE
ncbi:hypothetical protein [Candidatus Thiodiazotropha endoloripes]|uniref:hypothetical protein n=1 Tax=Candidatus Thiodiazotropha endoloripes TaxID=1818881 RepID=UPI000A8AC1DC|nr:hypothetical protein [Candidatus Thiodiazotropha endoloripes]